MGYREGITAGKESALQEGFDEGFALTGAPIGRHLGLLRGFAATLVAFVSSGAALPAGVDCQAALDEARSISGALSAIRFSDIAPPDLQAEQHAREHLEAEGDVVEDEGLQVKRDIESLEDMMARISAGTIPATDKSGRPTMDDVGRLTTRVKALANALQLPLPTPTQSE